MDSREPVAGGPGQLAPAGRSIEHGLIERASLLGQSHLIAERLLGCLLVVARPSSREPTAARVVEVEAYGGVGEDPGSHAYAGRRPRNETMFAAPGRLYVYRSYGLHWCANVVVHDGLPGSAGAVLLRAATVVQGLDAARARRARARDDHQLARGPGVLCAALGIDGDDDGSDVCSATSPVVLLPGSPPARVGRGPRVGVGGAGAATPWRWWDAASRCVSRYRPAASRKRSDLPT